jgi:hypothetical protein
LALFGALLLIFIIFIRPQEFLPALQSLSILNVSSGIAALGIVIEMATGKLKSLWTPQLPFAFGFLAWCVVTVAMKVGLGTMGDVRPGIGLSTLFMLIVIYALAPRFERLRAMAILILGIAIAVAAVTAHQSTNPLECIVLEKDEKGLTGDRSQGEPIGIPCDRANDCAKKLNDYENEFVCEKPGLFRTFSIGSGRVRWRGLLADPNELALAIGVALSFAFALHSSARNALRHLFLFGTLALATYVVVQTSSRGGVLVLCAVIGVYFVRRFGARGFLIGLVLAAPVLLLGGREGEEADSSAIERTGALYDGIDFFKQNPLFGLGYGQFIENYPITAHNSYLLSAAELGLPGLLLFSYLVYASVKIPYQVSLLHPSQTDPRLLPYAFALVTSFAGMLVGIFFLSFCYNAILFIYFGLSGALYLIAKRSTPGFDVTISPKELGVIAGLDVGLLALIFVYTRIKGPP